MHWGKGLPWNCLLSRAFITPTIGLFESYSIKWKPPLCLLCSRSGTWDIHSLGVNAPRVWDTVHRAAWGSPADKRVPQPLDTSPCSPCSTRAGPATMQGKEKIQKNSSPQANLLLRPPVGRLLADIMVSTDWVQPPKWSCGSTGENSHLASFKRKVQSQLLYSQSGNGHNLKLLSFKKKKTHSPSFSLYTFIWWKIWFKRELSASENLASVSVHFRKEWRTKKPSYHARDDP